MKQSVKDCRAAVEALDNVAEMSENGPILDVCKAWVQASQANRLALTHFGTEEQVVDEELNCVYKTADACFLDGVARMAGHPVQFGRYIARYNCG